MEKIPSAEEFYHQAINDPTIGDDITDLMNAYARLHVKAALKEAVKHLPYDDKMNQSLLDERAILNSYPLEKIK